MPAFSYYSKKAIALYGMALLTVSLLFYSYALPFVWIVFGIVEVCSFFLLVPFFLRKWAALAPGYFMRSLFWTALFIRAAYVVFSYYFYIRHTGQPFEFEAADSVGYHEEAAWLVQYKWNEVFDYLFVSREGISDSGYPGYLTVLYSVLGPAIMPVRLLKCLLSAWTCVLVYKLADRNFGESVGRLAAIFCLLMPNLIYYCGLHLKETEMLWIVMLFLERADFLLQSRHYSFWNIVLPLVLAGVLFLFRTVLALAALFALLTSVFFLTSKGMGRFKRIFLLAWMAIAILVFAGGGRIMNEVEQTWEQRETNLENKRKSQVSKGMAYAQYATKAVMAPIIFTVPFSTMVETESQENQQMIHGGNFVKNVLAFFTVFTLLVTLFRNKNWRDFSLIGSFAIAYLGILVISAYSNAERFHLPALPCLLIMAAYGISQITKKDVKFYNFYLVLLFFALVIWNWTKLSGRGMI